MEGRKGALEMLDLSALERMAAVDVDTVQRENLRELSEVRLDTESAKEERIADFVRQIGNPYCFLCGETVVKVRFSREENAASFDALFEQYLSSL